MQVSFQCGCVFNRHSCATSTNPNPDCTLRWMDSYTEPQPPPPLVTAPKDTEAMLKAVKELPMLLYTPHKRRGKLSNQKEMLRLSQARVGCVPSTWFRSSDRTVSAVTSPHPQSHVRCNLRAIFVQSTWQDAAKTSKMSMPTIAHSVCLTNLSIML